MVAADSDAIDCIEKLLDRYEKSSDEKVKKQCSVATLDDDGDNVLCRAIRKGKKYVYQA